MRRGLVCEAHLLQVGYRFFDCRTFPLEHADSLYGRSIDDGPWRHLFLPRPKGGLYGWQQAQAFSGLIVVEGLCDPAALWQAGFRKPWRLWARISILCSGLTCAVGSAFRQPQAHRVYLLGLELHRQHEHSASGQ
jgi:hypothetical protein